MSGLDARQLRDLCVKPALAALGLPGGLPMEKLVMGTAAHESDGFRYIHQLGKGPALSLWQMEPATAMDSLERAPSRLTSIMFDMSNAWPGKEEPATFEHLIESLPGNLYLGAAMCRLVYYMKPFSVTELYGGEPGALAHVWKRWYNSPAGAGTEGKFMENWNRHCSGIYP